MIKKLIQKIRQNKYIFLFWFFEIIAAGYLSFIAGNPLWMVAIHGIALEGFYIMYKFFLINIAYGILCTIVLIVMAWIATSIDEDVKKEKVIKNIRNRKNNDDGEEEDITFSADTSETKEEDDDNS